MSEFSRRGSPTLTSVKDLPVKQDGPPPGGFFSIRFGRRIPSGGIRGTAFFIGGLAVMAYGWNNVKKSHERRRRQKDELLAVRRAVLPVLEAEDDRRLHAAEKEWLSMEAKVMEGTPGWVVGKDVYEEKHPKRYIVPFPILKMCTPPAERQWDA